MHCRVLTRRQRGEWARLHAQKIIFRARNTWQRWLACALHRARGDTTNDPFSQKITIPKRPCALLRSPSNRHRFSIKIVGFLFLFDNLNSWTKTSRSLENDFRHMARKKFTLWLLTLIFERTLPFISIGISIDFYMDHISRIKS